MQRLTLFFQQIHPLILASLLLSFLAFFVFGSAGHDDSHITYSAAKMLADGHGIANTNGEKIEQGTSLLHVLILGGLYYISGLELPLLGLLFSFFMSALALVLSWQLIKITQIPTPRTALLFIAGSTAFSYWSIGGLETPLISCCLLALVITLSNLQSAHAKGNSLLLALCILSYIAVRPEAIFILLAFSMGSLILLTKETDLPHSHKLFFMVCMLALAFFTLLMVWRYYYFGQFFPQPVYAKSASFSIEKIIYGLGYFIWSAQPSLVIYTLLLFTAAIAWFKNKALNNFPLLLCLAMASTYITFIVVSGGDWMGAGRFFVPAIPFLVIASFHQIHKLNTPQRWLGAISILLVIEAIFFARYLALGIPFYRLNEFKASFEQPVDFSDHSWVEASNVVHVLDIQFLNVLTPLIEQSAKEKLNIGSIQMGMTPFYLRQKFGNQLRFIDLRGLITKELTGCNRFNKYPRIQTGIFVNYVDYFKVQSSGECNLPKFDIIYDLLNNVSKSFSNKQLQIIENSGYTIIYRQKGGIKDLSGDMHVKSHAFIAVSEEIYSALPEELRYQEFPLSNYDYPDGMQYQQ